MPRLERHRARYVPGETTEDAVAATGALVEDGPARHPRLPRRGHPRPRAGRRDRATPTSSCSARSRRAWPATPRSRSSSSAVGQALPGDGEQDRARERPHDLPRGAQRRHHGDPRHGGPHHHRLDAGDPARAAQGLPRDRRRAAGLPAPHRGRLPRPGYEGSRVRLCKGAYNEPESVAFQDKHDVDKSYVRCLKVLMAGQGYPMVATHDPRLVDDRRRARGARTAARQGTTSTRCSSASAPTSSAGSPARARRCASTCPTARSGTAT